MSALIEGLLKLSRISQSDIKDEQIDLSALCHELATELRDQDPQRDVNVDIQAGVTAKGDRHLLHDALANLISNAWKFTAHTPQARVRFGSKQKNGVAVYFVQDNGAGFDQAYADKLFSPFQRLHQQKEFPGTGIGLSTVERIIARHSGAIWASSHPGEGATFYFTLHSDRPQDDV